MHTLLPGVHLQNWSCWNNRCSRSLTTDGFSQGYIQTRMLEHWKICITHQTFTHIQTAIAQKTQRHPIWNPLLMCNWECWFMRNVDLFRHTALQEEWKWIMKANDNEKKQGGKMILKVSVRRGLIKPFLMSYYNISRPEDQTRSLRKSVNVGYFGLAIYTTARMK